MSEVEHSLVRVVFKLQVEDGYPPAEEERLWAKIDERGACVLDNIPLFVVGYALGDTVETVEFEGALFVTRLIEIGGHSTVVVLFNDPNIPMEVIQHFRAQLVTLGCESEFDDSRAMLSVDIPPAGDYGSVKRFLDDRTAEALIEWWCSTPRHADPPQQ